MTNTSAPAGWYDAGTPGRLRWWDGSQWTAHECEAQARPVTAETSRSAALPTQPLHDPGIPMGWYAVPGTAETRWWDGGHWTAYRIAGGTPRGSWYAVEPPGVAYAFGVIFLALGLVQASLALVSPSAVLAAVGPLLLGVFWLSAAIALSAVRGRPAPAMAAADPEAVQPLPGRAEGPGAGWVPLTPRLSRWWSGARWGEYVLESGRVRPTHGGARTFRVLKVMAAVALWGGLLVIAAGVVLLATGWLGSATWIGALVLIGGVAFAVVGAILIPVVHSRRHALLLPEQAPAPSV
ncbi:DUF2510 domain-containing protein [Leucobacter sp. wl10]|uniref:DUF2510 domain-containing protein n=1 Tax=Leucobacter sp. wl10 TaxID=2304677 RepID=UPI001968EA01|nr:DUF2510 domain-containing protein [Leucobacter sp. wl10]